MVQKKLTALERYDIIFLELIRAKKFGAKRNEKERYSMSSYCDAAIKRNFKSNDELKYILESYFGVVYDEKVGKPIFKKSAVSHNTLTKISYVKELDLFRISYNVPDVGRQFFDFQGNIFLEAYDESKYKHFKPTDEYSSFDEIFFGNYYDKANRIVRLIFALYCISPTTLRKCTRQDKKRVRTLVLPVKSSFVEKVYEVPKQKNIKSDGISMKKSQQFNPNLSQEDRLQCELICIESVQLAAKKHDLNFFDNFLRASSKLDGIPYPNKAYQKKCFENFKKSVDNLKNK